MLYFQLTVRYSKMLADGPAHLVPKVSPLDHNQTMFLCLLHTRLAGAGVVCPRLGDFAVDGRKNHVLNPRSVNEARKLKLALSGGE